MKKPFSRSWARKQGVIVLLLLSVAFTGVADATIMEAAVTGTVYDSSDPANVLGYGGSNLADGSRVTLTFQWSTTTAPSDYYGGARFPVEADYITFGDNPGAPSWINSTVKFDNGVTWHSSAYSNSSFTTDQVKIQDNCYLCSGSCPGSTSPVWDLYLITDGIGGVSSSPTGSFYEDYQVSARICDYTENLVHELTRDQLMAWTPGAPGSYGADGYFVFHHSDDGDTTQNFDTWGYILPDSLVVMRVPEPMPIDIQPGSLVNRINLKKPGTVSVAVLSSADFHAPDRVDRTSLTFGRAGDEVSLVSCSKNPRDVNGDGLRDLVCSFSAALMGFQAGDTVGVLKGRTVLGTAFTGSDTVTIFSGK